MTTPTLPDQLDADMHAFTARVSTVRGYALTVLASILLAAGAIVALVVR